MDRVYGGEYAPGHIGRHLMAARLFRAFVASALLLPSMGMACELHGGGQHPSFSPLYGAFMAARSSPMPDQRSADEAPSFQRRLSGPRGDAEDASTDAQDDAGNETSSRADGSEPPPDGSPP